MITVSHALLLHQYVSHTPHIVTPPEYQPPGFQHSDFNEYFFKQDPLNIKVGDVATVRNSLSIFVVCYYVVVIITSAFSHVS